MKKSSIISIFNVSYLLFGKVVKHYIGHFEDLRKSILKSRLKISLEAYVSTLTLFTVAVFVLSFASCYFYTSYLLKFSLPTALLVTIPVSILSAALTFSGIYSYPSIKASSFARRIEEDLPYAVAHMNVLATAGAPPETIIRSVASIPKDAVAEFFSDIVRDIDLLGLDLIGAIRKARERCPSKTLEGFLSELEAIVISGGNLQDYLASFERELLGIKAIQAKEFTETLGTLAEVFIITMVVLPLLLITMLSIMSLVGGTLLGLPLNALMFFITYILVPAMGIIYLLILDMIMPRGE